MFGHHSPLLLTPHSVKITLRCTTISLSQFPSISNNWFKNHKCKDVNFTPYMYNRLSNNIYMNLLISSINVDKNQMVKEQRNNICN